MNIFISSFTLGDETFKYTIVGANEVFANCDG